jgi:hypothetical protein
LDACDTPARSSANEESSAAASCISKDHFLTLEHTDEIRSRRGEANLPVKPRADKQHPPERPRHPNGSLISTQRPVGVVDIK